MANPLFNLLNRNNMTNNNMTNMINSFKAFSANFQGDPRARVQHLLNTGQMSQAQFNQLRDMANQFQNILNH